MKKSVPLVNTKFDVHRLVTSPWVRMISCPGRMPRNARDDAGISTPFGIATPWLPAAITSARNAGEYLEGPCDMSGLQAAPPIDDDDETPGTTSIHPATTSAS